MAEFPVNVQFSSVGLLELNNTPPPSPDCASLPVNVQFVSVGLPPVLDNSLQSYLLYFQYGQNPNDLVEFHISYTYDFACLTLVFLFLE